MRIRFKPDNKIRYGQDFRVYKNIPSGIWFEIEEKDEYYILVAPGYGERKAYGNGSLHVRKRDLSIIEIEKCMR